MDISKFDKKKLLFLIIPFVILAIYDFFGEILIYLIYRVFTIFSVSENFVNSSTSFIDATLAGILSIVFYIFYRKVFAKKKAEVSLSIPKGAAFSVVIGFGVGGMAMIWLNLVDFLASYSKLLAKKAESFSSLYDDMEQGAFIWTFLAIVVLGPLIEEILFRGIIFRSFENVTNMAGFPILLSGVMFGIWHGSFIQGVYTAITGIILGYLIKKSRSLFIVVIAHGVNNLSGNLPPFLDTDFNNMLLDILSYICIIPMFLILFYLHRQGKMNE